MRRIASGGNEIMKSANRYRKNFILRMLELDEVLEVL